MVGVDTGVEVDADGVGVANKRVESWGVGEDDWLELLIVLVLGRLVLAGEAAGEGSGVALHQGNGILAKMHSRKERTIFGRGSQVTGVL